VHLPTGHLLVGGNAIGECENAVDLWCAKCALLEERHERVEEAGRRNGIAGASIDSEQPAFIVIEVDQVEADATVTGGSNHQLSATCGQSFERWLEHRAADGVEHDLGAPSLRCGSDDGIEWFRFEEEELVERRCSRRIGTQRVPINADDAGASPLANLSRGTTNEVSSCSTASTRTR
jgi:hypothetical protein